jgi:hypothetical protein
MRGFLTLMLLTGFAWAQATQNRGICHEHKFQERRERRHHSRGFENSSLA